MNYLIVLIFCLLTVILYIPTIRILYWLRLQDRSTKRLDTEGNQTPIFSSLKATKDGTPTGGGVLIVLTSILGLMTMPVSFASQIIVSSLLLFGSIGLLDDLKRIGYKNAKLLGLGFKTKLILQMVAAFFLSSLLVSNTSSITILPGVIFTNQLGLFLLFVLLIIFMANAFNITDGVDGLSIGLFIILMIGFSAVPFVSQDILPAISILLGTSLAYLYFNIPPARILMGDTGSLGLGAVIPVLFILTDKLYLLPIFGGAFIFEAFTSLVQLSSKRFLKRKVFPIAPFHHLLEWRGWTESKVTMRLWWAGIVLALCALTVVS